MSGAQTVILDALDAAELDTITGATSGTSVVTFNDTTNISADTVTLVDTVTIGGTNQTLTLADDDTNVSANDNITTITGSGTSDLVIADPGADDGPIDLSVATITGFDNLSATANAAADLIVSAASFSTEIVTLYGAATTDLRVTDDITTAASLTITGFDSIALDEAADLTIGASIGSVVTVGGTAGGVVENLTIRQQTAGNLNVSAIATITDALVTVQGTSGSDNFTLTDDDNQGAAYGTEIGMHIDISQGGADEVQIDNTDHSAGGTSGLGITGFTTGITAEADQLRIINDNSTATATQPTFGNYVIVSSLQSDITVSPSATQYTVVEIGSGVDTVADLDDTGDAGDVETALAASIDNVTQANASGPRTFIAVIYGSGTDAGKVGVYSVEHTNMPNDLVTGNITVDLLAIFEATADSMTSSNFD